MKKNPLLERLSVSFRCPMDWENMAGDERQRFCEKCQKSVTDLSQLTASEVESFVAEKGPQGRACVRILRDHNGQLITKGCGSSAARAKRTTRKAVAVGLASSGLAAAACSSQPKLEDTTNSGETPFSLPSGPENANQPLPPVTMMVGLLCPAPESE